MMIRTISRHGGDAHRRRFPAAAGLAAAVLARDYALDARRKGCYHAA